MPNATQNSIKRDKVGLQAGLVGMGSNILLFSAKLFAGLGSGSIAIIADAVNNLADTASSVITMAGFAASRKPADKEHPYGHARMEYMAGLFVAIAIILVGAELLRSSVQKITHPAPVSVSLLTIAILVAAVAIKLVMWAYYKKAAGAIHSSTLLVAARDSRNDVFASAAVLLATALQQATGFHLDGWFGAAVALFILVSGVVSVREMISPLLGEAPDQDLVHKLYKEIMAAEGVMGVHDLMVHSYGPERAFASVHVEMESTLAPMVSHGVLDNLERDIENKYGVKLVAHYDPLDPPTEETQKLHGDIEAIVRRMNPMLTIHDLRTVRTHDHTNVIFDVGVPSEYVGKTEDLRARISTEVALMPGNYVAVVQIDRNYTTPFEA